MRTRLVRSTGGLLPSGCGDLRAASSASDGVAVVFQLRNVLAIEAFARGWAEARPDLLRWGRRLVTHTALDEYVGERLDPTLRSCKPWTALSDDEIQERGPLSTALFLLERHAELLDLWSDLAEPHEFHPGWTLVPLSMVALGRTADAKRVVDEVQARDGLSTPWLLAIHNGEPGRGAAPGKGSTGAGPRRGVVSLLFAARPWTLAALALCLGLMVWLQDARVSEWSREVATAVVSGAGVLALFRLAAAWRALTWWRRRLARSRAVRECLGGDEEVLRFWV
jgi:hypothetical protein